MPKQNHPGTGNAVGLDYNSNPSWLQPRPPQQEPADPVRCPACGSVGFRSIRYRRARRRWLWLEALPARLELVCGLCRHHFTQRPGTVRVNWPSPRGPFGP